MEHLRTYRREWSVIALLVLLAGTLYAFEAHARAEWRAAAGRVQANNLQIAELESQLRRLDASGRDGHADVLARLPDTLDIPGVLLEQASVAAKSGVTVTAFQFAPSSAVTVQPKGGPAKGSANGATAAGSAGALGSSGAAASGGTGTASLRSCPVQVSVAGRTANILRFIRGLNDYPRWTVVHQVNWTTVNPGGVSAAEVTYNVYALGP